MHPDHLVRALRRSSDLRDGDRGGVGRQDRVRGGDVIQTREDVLLDLHLLHRGFHHERRIRDVFHTRRALDTPEDLGRLALGELALLDEALEALLDRAEAALERILVHVDELHDRVVAREGLGDAIAHRAGADHGEQRRCSDKPDAGSFEGPHFTALVCRLQKHRSVREPFDFGRCADALRREAPAACVAERFFDNLARRDGDADIQEAGFRLDADNRRVIAEIFSVVGREALKPPPDLIAQVTPCFGGERLDPVQSQFGRQQQIHRRVPPVPSRDPLSHRFNQVLEIRRAMHGFAPVLPAAEGALDQ